MTGKRSGQPLPVAQDMAAPTPSPELLTGPALHTAVRQGRLREVEKLLAEGADIEEKVEDPFNETALHVCCHRSTTTDQVQVLMVQLLVAHNADVSAKNFYRNTPLHSAACRQDHEVVAKALLDLGADVATTNALGRTPLHCAVMYGDEAMATLLLTAGADLSAKDIGGIGVRGGIGGMTPLHLALHGDTMHVNMVKMVELLLAKGADVSARNNLGETPKEDATRRSLQVTGDSHRRLLHQIAAMIEAEEVRRAKCMAFAMGLGGRLGVDSCVNVLDEGVLRLVLEHV